MMAMSNPAGADQEHRLTTPSNLCSFERYFKDYFAGQNAEFVVLPRSPSALHSIETFIWKLRY